MNDEGGEAVAASIRDDGGEAAYQHCDVTNPDEVQALMAAAADAFGASTSCTTTPGSTRPACTPAECSVVDMPIDVFKTGRRGQCHGALDLLQDGVPVL